MARYDRLSALIARFALSVAPATPAEANLLAFGRLADGAPSRVLFCPRGPARDDGGSDEQPLFCAHADWGGGANPLFSALPGRVELTVGDDIETASLVQLLKAESEARRCGSGTVLDRLGEVLMVRLLRAQIERGAANGGLLGGLADPRLGRAIVAMHERPGHAWRNEDLAKVAGLSLSRFAQLFAATVGVTPMAYLRRWRMTLARQDIERGDRIQKVARRYGYGSGEALNRSFRRQYGETPMQLRRGAAASEHRTRP